MLCGASMAGILSDFFGRIRTVVPLLIAMAAIGVGAAFAPSLWVFMASRFFHAMLYIGENYQPDRKFSILRASRFVFELHKTSPVDGLCSIGKRQILISSHILIEAQITSMMFLKCIKFDGRRIMSLYSSKRFGRERFLLLPLHIEQIDRFYFVQTLDSYLVNPT